MSTRKSSWAERKLARQRQMEMMEAVASGTAPTMELDTTIEEPPSSSGAGRRPTTTTDPNLAATAAQLRAGGAHGGGLGLGGELGGPAAGMQQRGGGSGIGGPGGGGPIPMGGGAISSAELFERPRVQTLSAVNLMDHRTGIYQEKTGTGLTENLSQALTSVKGLFGGKADLYDASPSDDYVQPSIQPGKQRPQYPTTKKPSRRLNTLWAACCDCLQRHTSWLVSLGVVGFFLLLVLLVVVLSGPFKRKRLYKSNSMRHDTIESMIQSSGLSHAEHFDNHTSPQTQALRWISFSDPANIQKTADNEEILQVRYALAVFYYGCYQFFSNQYGEQDPIEIPDNRGNISQWEGVPNPGWRRHDYWMTAKGYCSWYGITCQERTVDGQISTKYDDNGIIESIDLSNNHVYGTLPAEFKVLTKMNILSFANNKLFGTFPPQLGRMYNIHYLLLNHNKLTGTIPTWIGFMEGLQELHLQNNQFSGTLPTGTLGRLLNLRYLALQYNEKLMGTLPDDLEKLSDSLTRLDITNNNFSGTLPHAITELMNVQQLSLANNSFTGHVPPALGNLWKLRTLDLENNFFEGQLDQYMFQTLLDLEELDLQQNQLTGPLPVSLGVCEKLTSMTLNENMLTGTIPSDWTSLTHLKVLDISHNRLKGPLPSSSSSASSPTDEPSPFWSNLTALETLILTNNTVSGSIPPQISMASQLKVVYLEHNQFQGTVPTTMGQLTLLQTLRLIDNQLTGTMPSDVCALQTQSVGVLRALAADCLPREDARVIQCTCCICH